MEKYNLAHGNNIYFNLDIECDFAIDEPDFFKHEFTVCSVYRNDAGRIYETLEYGDGSIEFEEIWRPINKEEFILLSQNGASCRFKTSLKQPPALTFKRKEERIRLLQAISPGRVQHEYKFIKNEIGVKIPIECEEYSTKILHRRGSPFTLLFDTDTLKSSSSSKKHKSDDFALFLQEHYVLDLECAWLLGWVILRSAYANEWELVDSIISQARRLKKNQNHNFHKCMIESAHSLKQITLTEEETLGI